jgi:hypothetical protein
MHHSVPHTASLPAAIATRIDHHYLHCRVMKMSSWLKKTKNNGEAGSSSSACCPSNSPNPSNTRIKTLKKIMV